MVSTSTFFASKRKYPPPSPRCDFSRLMTPACLPAMYQVCIGVDFFFFFFMFASNFVCVCVCVLSYLVLSFLLFLNRVLNGNVLSIGPAPEPDDVIWENLEYGFWR